jgi:hypothetical protein
MQPSLIFCDDARAKLPHKNTHGHGRAKHKNVHYYLSRLTPNDSVENFIFLEFIFLFVELMSRSHGMDFARETFWNSNFQIRSNKIEQTKKEETEKTIDVLR